MVQTPACVVLMLLSLRKKNDKVADFWNSGETIWTRTRNVFVLRYDAESLGNLFPAFREKKKNIVPSSSRAGCSRNLLEPVGLLTIQHYMPWNVGQQITQR